MNTPTNTRIGEYVVSTAIGETVRAYVPPPLPPNPAVDLSAMQSLLAEANQAVGRLDGLARSLPDPRILVYSYVRKEAVLSSQIEGTQSSLSDLLLYESHYQTGVPIADVAEVSSYVAALEHGLTRLRGGFPPWLRLIREIHGVLLATGRGRNRQPGEFRVSQNWIGGTRPGNAFFVPCPPDRMLECLNSFELFLYDDRLDMPLLVKVALAHVQFETIHPFLDGNGRVGRLLVTLLLCIGEVLREPVLYLSVYLKRHRQTYYDLLSAVRSNGDWESWLEFFIQGVRDTSVQAAQMLEECGKLFEADLTRIRSLASTRAGVSLVYQAVQKRPLLSIRATAELSGLTFPAATSAIHRLEDAGILREITGGRRNRVYSYHEFLDLLNRE